MTGSMTEAKLRTAPMEKFRIQVPASTANLGPGFDTLGIALQLYLTVDVQLADKTVIRYLREEDQQLPVNEDNLILRMIKTVYREAGVPAPEVEIVVDNRIPLARGLGSSAAAIIAGLSAGNALLGNRFTTAELHKMATKEEGHPDNVGASLYGGFVVSTWDGNEVHAFQNHPPDDLHIIALIPAEELATSKARNVLPDMYAQQDVTFNIGHSSLLVASMLSGHLDLLNVALRDRIHQPYRFDLIPHGVEVKQVAEEAGAYGVVISGAGPTLLVLCHQSSKPEVIRRLQYTVQGTTQVQHLPIAKQGVHIHHINKSARIT